jgi:hypothetical protein
MYNHILTLIIVLVPLSVPMIVVPAMTCPTRLTVVVTVATMDPLPMRLTLEPTFS